MRVRADRSAQFPDANSFRCLRQSFLRPPEFVEHERKLKPESDRLGVNAVAPANHWRHFESARLRGNRGSQVGQILCENPGRLGQLDCQRCVENIGRR